MKYVYSFQVWPDETRYWGVGKAEEHPMFKLYSIVGRMEMILTEEEFKQFRQVAQRNCVTLREIERVPYHEPEMVS